MKHPGGQQLAERVSEAYHEEVDRTHQSLLNAALAFAGTFAALRVLTYAIREGLVPWGNVVARGTHIHHYVWGVALLLVIGLFSLVVDTPRYNPWLGAVYGFASALVIDEFALLLNLRDVYWTNEGRLSVDLALGLMALSAVYLAATSFWRRLGHELLASVRRRWGRRRSTNG
jgi:hypothetical protein